MRFKQYGITLRRVEKRDIELIRKARNSVSIKNNMIFRETITKEMQKKWFKSIEKHTDKAYYIIIHKRRKIGLIDIRNINSSNESEGGLFLFSKKDYNTFIPVIASLLLIKSGFYILKVKDYSYIKVLKSNKKAIDYNKSLGYFIVDETNEYYKMKITVQSYEKATKKIQKAIKNLYGDSKFEFILEPIDYKLNLHKKYEALIKTVEPDCLRVIEKENYKKLILNI